MEKTQQGNEFMERWAAYGIRRKFFYTPAALIEDPNLNSQAKLLFILINSYCKNYGYCFASNETLGGKLGLKRTMVKTYLKELLQSQLIEVNNSPALKFQRRIYINFKGLMKRYPKLTIEIPATAKVSDKARRIILNAK
jgi:DNA-binding MarR family transcriptional regulator